MVVTARNLADVESLLSRYPGHALGIPLDVTDAALEWLRSVRGQPSFLFLNYMDAHAPYRPPPPFDRSFLPEEARSRLWPDLYRPPDLKALPSAAELRHRAALYDGAIAFLDQEVGRLLTELETAGVLAERWCHQVR